MKQCKWLLSLCLVLIALCLVAQPAQAADLYEYEIVNGNAVITGCDPSVTGSITIPSKLGGYPVTQIGPSAFADCTGITAVTIPNTVKLIDAFAFENNRQLMYLTLPDSLRTIGDYAFCGCVNLSQIAIPVQTTQLSSVGDYAFNGCENLYGFEVIPSSFLTRLEHIGANVLTGTGWWNELSDGVVYLGTILYGVKGDCPTALTVKDGTTTILAEAFMYEDGLTAVTIPDSVTTIGEAAFQGTAIQTVKIPNKVTHIVYDAFGECKNLRNVTIPQSVKTIDGGFDSSDNIETVFYLGTQAQWDAMEKNCVPNENILAAEVIFQGFYQKNGETYYGENGQKVTGWKTIGDKTYYLKKGTGGTLAKGWTTIGGKQYYFKKGDGTMVTGIVTIAGAQHQFSDTGVWEKQLQPLSVTKQPVSVWVAKGKTATVSVTATGEDLKYTWYVLNPGASKYVKSSITKSSYSFAMTADKSGRKVYCIVTDMLGKEVKTNTVTMGIGTVKITKQPVSVKAGKNKMATVTVTATGEGLKYTWYVLNPGASSYVKSSITKNSYAFSMTADKSGRKVYCVVTDKYGQTVKTNTVTMSMAVAPKITKQPVSVKVSKGATATVSLTASGEGLTYTWYVQNPGTTKWVKSSITKNTYSFAMSTEKSGRKVYCVVTDKYGQTVKTNTVSLSMK